MRKLILAAVCLLVLSSCHFSPPVGGLGEPDQAVQTVPHISDLTGKWCADSASYQLLKKKGIVKPDSLSILLRDDSTFTIFNYPNLFTDTAGKFTNTKLYKSEGKWAAYKSSESEVSITFDFSPGLQYPDGFGDSFFLFKRKAKFRLIRFLGDPDSGEFLTFVKQ